MEQINGKMVRTVLTSKAEGAAQSKTTLTLDFAGCDLTALKAFAAATLTIRRQNTWRKKGIPASETVLVKDYVPGMRQAEAVTVENTVSRAATMTKVERDAIIAQLRALDVVAQQPTK